MGGKRFYYPRDIKAFIGGNTPCFDGEGGSREERVMLGMRLSRGVALSEFGYGIEERVKKLKAAGLLKISGDRVSLTDSGMLVSNSIITELLYEDL